MGDVLHRFGEERHVLRHQFGFFNLRMRGERADAQPRRAQLDAAKVAHAGDVDKKLGMRKAYVQRGDEALAAGEDLRARTLDQLERLGERLSSGIGERRRFQNGAPPRRRLCTKWTTLFS